jgi:prepilin-type processing-associated H-X9-DG protein
VELLVVIGIIGILVGILIPMLRGARRGADRVKCLSNLRQIGAGYFTYAIDNKGWWPMAEHQWIENVATRDKRWLHFISKYVNRSELNWDGTNPAIQGTIKDSDNVLWGCPAWRRATYTGPLLTVNSDLHNGYSMNLYPMAPAMVQTQNNSTNWVYRLAAGTLAQTTGWYYKQCQWRQPSARALVMDSVNINTAVISGWPWWTPVTAPMPAVPDSLAFSIDFNRHSKYPTGTKAGTPSVNVLFCDGHASTLSAKESHYAVRFAPGSAP